MSSDIRTEPPLLATATSPASSATISVELPPEDRTGATGVKISNDTSVDPDVAVEAFVLEPTLSTDGDGRA
jgi:hypothetical protein